jgi:hypothetical protein
MALAGALEPVHLVGRDEGTCIHAGHDGVLKKKKMCYIYMIDSHWHRASATENSICPHSFSASFIPRAVQQMTTI